MIKVRNGNKVEYMETEAEKRINEAKKKAKSKLKDKPFKTLSTVEKDELLENVCKILGLI